MQLTIRPFALTLSLLPLLLSTGCSDSTPGQVGGAGSGGSAGTNGSAGSAAAGVAGSAGKGVLLVPDESGWVDGMAEGNTIGVQGAWYPYGDQYGVAKCTMVGMHPAEECSTIVSPDPLVSGFPNEGGVMCTTGETAVVVPCGAGVPGCNEGSPDYSNVWGAGIGLDLNAEGETDGGTGEKHPWSPDEHGVIGVAFDIDVVPAPTLRVEFPIELPDGTTTENHPDGSPYWGGTSTYPPSPVVAGHNEFRWASVTPPRTNYEFDRSKIIAIQFHVPAVTVGTTRGAYSFCISNLTFLTQ